jgi:hypothetical protein
LARLKANVHIKIDILGVWSVTAWRHLEDHAGGYRPPVAVADRELPSAKYSSRGVEQSRIRGGLFQVDVNGFFRNAGRANDETNNDPALFLGALFVIRVVLGDGLSQCIEWQSCDLRQLLECRSAFDHSGIVKASTVKACSVNGC